MTSVESGAHPHRLSDADRERALLVLREGAAQGRVSHDTFMRRVDVILGAQREDELRAVLQDLPTRKPPGGWFVDAVARASAWPRALRRAWQAERLPELLLPPEGPYPLSIGRAPGSVLRLNHFTVSRTHAQLRARSDCWTLRDLGSTNGTWVNGSRVTASVTVRPGDQVRFGQVAFRLTLPVTQPPPRPAADPVAQTRAPQARLPAQPQLPARVRESGQAQGPGHGSGHGPGHGQGEAEAVPGRAPAQTPAPPPVRAQAPPPGQVQAPVEAPAQAPVQAEASARASGTYGPAGPPPSRPPSPPVTPPPPPSPPPSEG